MIGATVVSLVSPLLVKVAIDRGIERHDVHAIDLIAVLYIALVVVRPVLERAIVLCSARAGERFLGDLRVAAYEKLLALSMPFFEETRAGVLVSRLTADVQTLTTFTRLVLVEVVGSVLLFVVSVVILVWLSPLLSLVMLVSVPVLVWSSLRYGKRSRPAFLALRDRVADTMSSLQEGLAGVRVVQSFGQETGSLRVVPQAVECAGFGLAADLARQHRLLPGDRVRAVARARSGAHRRRLPRATRTRHGRDDRRVRALPHLALRSDCPTGRLVQRVPVRPCGARQDRGAARGACHRPRR